MDPLPAAIPAATLVLLRDRTGGPPEMLMMERPAHMAFAAGALVFPGGRIDPQDGAAAAGSGNGSALTAARFAAVRETLEETGIGAGLIPDPPAEALAAMRARLLDGDNFASILADNAVALQPDALVPFARWCPNFKETRRFDATFFLAAAPRDAPPPTPQPGEVTRTFWASAADILEEIGAGRAHAIFPTMRNLERLARFSSFADACADAQRHPVRTITPWVERRHGRDWVCIPDDLGYPITAEPLDTARRR